MIQLKYKPNRGQLCKCLINPIQLGVCGGGGICTGTGPDSCGSGSDSIGPGTGSNSDLVLKIQTSPKRQCNFII